MGCEFSGIPIEEVLPQTRGGLPSATICVFASEQKHHCSASCELLGRVLSSLLTLDK